MTVFEDHELKAYLNGSLSPDRAAQLEAQIETDDTLEARLLAFDRAQAAPVQAAFADVAPATSVQSLSDLVASSPAAQQAPRLRWVFALPGLAVAACFALITFLAFGNTGQPDLRWQEQVAIYQALYVEDTLTPLQGAPGDVGAQLSASEAALGRALPAAVVGDLDGLPLLRAQILGLDGAPLIQMAYLTDDGTPVALCVTQGAGASEVVSETLAGLQSVHWSDGAFSYMIVGDVDASRLQRMATQVQTRL